jgi:hypothetical protein
MRLKKTILYVDPNEKRLSTMVFALRTNGYRVMEACDIAGVSALLTNPNVIDLVLIQQWPAAPPETSNNDLVICNLCKAASHFLPVILLRDEKPTEDHMANFWLDRATLTTFDLLIRAKVMSARKRGPRKGVARVVALVEQKPALAAKGA